MRFFLLALAFACTQLSAQETRAIKGRHDVEVVTVESSKDPKYRTMEEVVVGGRSPYDVSKK